MLKSTYIDTAAFDTVARASKLASGDVRNAISP